MGNRAWSREVPMGQGGLENVTCHVTCHVTAHERCGQVLLSGKLCWCGQEYLEVWSAQMKDQRLYRHDYAPPCAHSYKHLMVIKQK